MVVVYFHVDEDRWRSAHTIPDGQKTRLYLAAGGTLSDTAAPTPHMNELTVDPRRLAGPEGERPSGFVATWPPRGAALVYTGTPLPNPLNISGRFTANLTLSTDLPDFDLLVEIYLIRDEAMATLLGDTVFRARHHTSLTHASR